MADILETDTSLDGFTPNVSTDADLSHVEDSLEQSNGGLDEPDAELEAIKARVKEMEAEAEKLKEMQNDVEKQMTMSPPPVEETDKGLKEGGKGKVAGLAFPTLEEKVEADARSVYVGNVDYGATAEELEQHFHGAGSVNRVTILCDKFTGHPKGFAYIEFAEKEAVETATALDGTLFRGRQLQVNPKRTNKHGISTTDRGGRGRFRGGRFRARHTPYYSRPRRYRGGRPRYYSSYYSTSPY